MIRDILNKLVWDNRENPEDCIITYIHRGAPEDKMSVSLKGVINICKGHFEYHKNGELVYIPYHRIITIFNKDKKIWGKE